MIEPLTLTPIQRGAAIAGGAMLLAVVLWLVYRGRLREDYAALWLAVAFLTFIFAIWEHGLRLLAQALDAVTLTAPIFLLGIAFLAAIALHFSVRLSDQSQRITRLAQDLALLRHDREERAGHDDRPTTTG